MKRWNLSYYLKEGVSNFFSHRLMSVAAITVITACLLITASFSLMAYNLSLEVAELETQSEIMVWVEDTYDQTQARGLESQILALENVDSAQFISKEIGRAHV